MGRKGRPTRAVNLKTEEREALEALVRAGVHSARRLRRAQMLLWADAGRTRAEIAGLLGAARETVRRILDRYLDEGVEAALSDRPRPGGQKRLDGKQEAILVALACSQAPAGRECWTMQLLADRIIELGVVDQVSDETVRRTLKKRS